MPYEYQIQRFLIHSALAKLALNEFFVLILPEVEILHHVGTISDNPSKIIQSEPLGLVSFLELVGESTHYGPIFDPLCVIYQEQYTIRTISELGRIPNIPAIFSELILYPLPFLSNLI